MDSFKEPELERKLRGGLRVKVKGGKRVTLHLHFSARGKWDG